MKRFAIGLTLGATLAAALAFAQPAFRPGPTTFGNFLGGLGTVNQFTKWITKDTIGNASLSDTATQTNASVCYDDNGALNCGGLLKYYRASDTLTPTNLEVTTALKLDALTGLVVAHAATAATAYAGQSCSLSPISALDPSGVATCGATVAGNVDVIPAGCNNATAAPAMDLPTASAPTAVCLGTGGLGALQYADGSTTAARAHFSLPATFTGAVDVLLVFTGDASSTNAVDWSVGIGCVGNGSALATLTINTASTSAAAGPATAGNKVVASITGIDTTGCVGLSTLFTDVKRLGSNVLDTYVGNAQLVEAFFTIRKTI